MILASDVKNYLRIDYAEDDTFIANIIAAGYDYLAAAIDDFSTKYSGSAEFVRQADIWVLAHWCPPMYDQREGMFAGQNMQMDYPARALLTQLQLYKMGPDTVPPPAPEPEPEPGSETTEVSSNSESEEEQNENTEN